METKQLVTLPRKPTQVERITHGIQLIRGQKVMLDMHLAESYGVPTKVFNRAVKRNRARFPSDFMFQLTPAESLGLRSEILSHKV